MSYDSEDQIFEDLPPRLRKRVLDAWATGRDIDDSGPVDQVDKKPSLRFLVLPVIIGVPVFLLGFVLVCTVLLAPIGFPLMALGCLPVSRALQRHDYSKD